KSFRAWEFLLENFLCTHVSECFPVTIDVGTNNQKLLDDEVYIGFRHKRATGQEYADLLDEFMSAIRQNYQEK
ncbi:hypothetical protein UlMin_005125, partial [Ulmus minor]